MGKKKDRKKKKLCRLIKRGDKEKIKILVKLLKSFDLDIDVGKIKRDIVFSLHRRVEGKWRDDAYGECVIDKASSRDDKRIKILYDNLFNTEN